jgi:hypothetical protein
VRPALRHAALFCAGAAAMLVTLELALRMLPVSVGLYQTERPDLWPLHSFQAHLPYTVSTTWELRNARHGRTNNYGHLAPFDYIPGARPVIVVGDSYIESQMNDYRDTLQGHLGTMLGTTEPVYGLGVSGMSMGDYLALADQASAEFAPRAAVFLLANGDIGESLTDQAGQYYFRETTGGWKLTLHLRRIHPLFTRVRQSVGDLYLFRYVTQNLRFTLPELAGVFREAKARGLAAPIEKEAAAQYAAVDRFLAELPRRSGIEPRCIAFLLDGDRYAIYDPRLASPMADLPEARAHFIRKASELGYRVADMQPLFREHYKSHRRHFDYFPIDAHWNGLGHRLAAERAYDLLFRQSGGHC